MQKKYIKYLFFFCSNHLYDLCNLPAPQIAKSDLFSKHLYNIPLHPFKLWINYIPFKIPNFNLFWTFLYPFDIK